MADPKKNPLIGAFRTPVPGTPPSHPAPPADQPPELSKVSADTPTKPAEGKKEPEAPKAPADAPAKSVDGKKVLEPSKVPADTPTKPAEGKKEPEAPKAPADAPAKPVDGKKVPEPSKVPADTPTKPAEGKKEPEAPKAPADAPAKSVDGKKVPEPSKVPADNPTKPAEGKKEPKSPKAPADTSAEAAVEEKDGPDKEPELRFVPLSKIKPLPGTYVKDKSRKDYSGLITDIKKNGLQKPIILRKSEKEGEFQLVDGFHRYKALEQAGMLEVRADVYEMTLSSRVKRP